MSKTRNLSDLLDANGDVKSTALDNVPASDVVNDTTPQLGGTLDTNGNPIQFGDNDKAQFGASQDLAIYHDGTQSIIEDVGTGQLKILAENTLHMGSATGTETYIRSAKNGSVEVYYDNSKKLETTSSGATVTGTLTADGVSVGDNEYINVGASNDLQISHQGTETYINEQGTGSLNILSNGTGIFLKKGVVEDMAKFNTDGAVELFYDNSKKFNTTSTGVAITGDLSVSGSISGAGKVGQVVFNHTSTRATYTMTGSGVTEITPLNTSITPTSTSSKVLIQIQISCEANHDGVFRLFRGSTEIGRNSNSTSRWSGFAYIDYDPDFNSTANTFFFQYVDSPSTTSSTQYKLAVGKSDGNNGTLNFNRCNGGTGADNQEIATSSMTLTEILP